MVVVESDTLLILIGCYVDPVKINNTPTVKWVGVLNLLKMKIKN